MISSSWRYDEFCFCFLSIGVQDEGKPHDGHGYFYEYHLNQGGDPENVLLHTLGHWRITQLFHDIVFLPDIAVGISCSLRRTVGWESF